MIAIAIFFVWNIKELYSFSDGYLVKTVKALDDSFNSAIIFSHDHGINTFVNKFGSQPIAHVTTCGMIGIRFDEKYWKKFSETQKINFLSMYEYFKSEDNKKFILDNFLYGDIHWNKKGTQIIFENVIKNIKF